MVVDVDDRATMEDVLRHDWLTGGAPPSVLKRQIADSLSTFAGQNKLQQFALARLPSLLGPDEMNTLLAQVRCSTRLFCPQLFAPLNN